MKYYWLRRSARQERVEKQYKRVKTLSQTREAARKKPLVQNPRKFSAIPFRPKRFYGFFKEAVPMANKIKGKVFNFGHLYFTGTTEEYDKL